MKCPDCGGDVAEHSKFCSRCGRRIGPPLAPPTAISADLPTERVDTLATEPVVVTDGPTIVLADDKSTRHPVGPTPPQLRRSPTAVYPVASTPTAGVTAPIIFDGSDDLADYPEEREPFRLRAMFVIALFASRGDLAGDSRRRHRHPHHATDRRDCYGHANTRRSRQQPRSRTR